MRDRATACKLVPQKDINVYCKDANRRGPHWADPLKAWGDVLAQQGRGKEALAKYDEALKFAPNWRQLKEAREALAKHQS